MSQLFDRVLSAARQLGASDVHLKAGLPPIFRIKGELRTVRDVPALTREAIAAFAVHIMNDRQRATFEESYDIDLAYGTPDGVRYRVNVFQQRGAVGMVLRLIPPEVPPFERLNLPRVVLDLADHSRGIILVTGVTGSGKSTTLAAMVDYVNTQHAYHIVTVEDPIEYTFRDKRSVINQRELGFDTQSFSRALRAALRQDPDVILVGEMRDNETAGIAITAAETGHLVLSTLHTADATETVNRIISMFPTHQQAQARLSLASVLRGVISQRLLPRADGKGMVPALEVLVNTERVREMIEDPARTREIKDAIAQGLHPYGMFTFDQSLANLVKQHLVTYDEAVKHSSSPSDFALLFRGVQGGGNQWQQGTTADAGDVAGGKGNDDFEIDRFTR
ncbi:MAG: type IV pilus twitching motility protein PilT [Kofleriaceae bacterium]|nr:type IV pilus twitching motility protein PilT [Kofleriaceae bacterium]MCL4228363.1 type IV pilus twitching motility protein PilT [Myxococcales bacterium]